MLIRKGNKPETGENIMKHISNKGLFIKNSYMCIYIFLIGKYFIK